MRLKKSRNEAEEELIRLQVEGYKIADRIRLALAPYPDVSLIPDEALSNPDIDHWKDEVVKALNSIFPTTLEESSFRHTKITVAPYTPHFDKAGMLVDFQNMVLSYVQTLEHIIQDSLPRYTDLPLQARLYIEDIDSFSKARNVNPDQVNHLLKNGNLDQSEDFIQLNFEQILNESFHRKDWGGEINDLYTSNLIVQGARTATAFLLKGNGLKKKELQLADCGKNGDQIIRLLESPAQLFIVQFVGQVSDMVIKDIEGKIELARAQGRKAWYCIINGQDTARILHAYGKL